MRGGARPGAGRKPNPDKPLTLTEIGQRIEVDHRGSMCRVAGRFLHVWAPFGEGGRMQSLTKEQALALLKRLEAREKK